MIVPKVCYCYPGTRLQMGARISHTALRPFFTTGDHDEYVLGSRLTVTPLQCLVCTDVNFDVASAMIPSDGKSPDK